jgi:hypothetical protein
MIKIRRILFAALLLSVVAIVGIIYTFNKNRITGKNLTLRDIPENVVLTIPCNDNMTLRLTGSFPALKVDLLNQDNQIIAKTTVSSRYSLPKYAIFNSKTNRQDLLIETRDGGTGIVFTEWQLYDLTSKKLTPLGNLYKNVKDVQSVDGLSTDIEIDSTIILDDNGLIQKSVTKLTLP